MAGSADDLFSVQTDRSLQGLKRFWLTAREYWRPGRSRIAWPLTLGMAAVVLISLAISLFGLWAEYLSRGALAGTGLRRGRVIGRVGGWRGCSPGQAANR